MRTSLPPTILVALAAAAGLTAGLAIGQAGRSDAATSRPGDLERLRAEYAPVLALTGTAKQEVLAIAALLARRPAMAIDFSATPAGHYCLNPGAGSMVHFSTRPERDPVDIVFVHDPAPFAAAGLDVGALPPQPGSVAEMRPNVWYYNDGTRKDPLHGDRAGAKLLVMGVPVP